jgi:hypothetical protein
MSYIGNQVTSVPHTVDVFTGNSVTTTFGPLTRAPAGTAAIAVFVGGFYQTPGIDYTLNGDVIIFNVAPLTGTNNIVIHHLGNGTTTQVPSDGSVTGTKLTSNSVRSNNIVAGQITGNLIADTSITSNQIVVGAITGNLIATNSINASNIINQLSITGNLIGTGAISANNFAGGGITSNVLASNLSISVARISETLGINASVIGSNSSVGANVTLNILDGTVYYFNANTSGNVTFNLRGNNSTLFDQAVQVGNTISVVVSLRHNTAAHRSGVNVAIDGGYINTTRANPDIATGNIIFYAANTTANHSAISAMESNMIGLSIFKKASNSYIVYLSQTIYGLGYN